MANFVIALLAGGDASRYEKSLKDSETAQTDKLLSVHKNKKLLRYVCDELEGLGDILVVTKDEKRKSCYSAILETETTLSSTNVILEDRKKPIGPLGGIHEALKHCPSNQPKLILPADLPNVKREVIADFLMKASQKKAFDLIALVHSNGQVENLSLVINGTNSLHYVESLIDAGIYRVSSLIRIIPRKCFINSAYLKTNSDYSDIFDVFRDFDHIYDISDKKMTSPSNQKIFNYVSSPFIEFGEDKLSPQDPCQLFFQFFNWTKKFPQNKESNSSIIGILKKESEIYRSRGLISISLHCLLDAYKIDKDPSLAEQITNIIYQLEKYD